MDNSPVIVGGIGGSGTRLITQVLQNQGVYMGGKFMNESMDDTLFTFLFKRCDSMQLTDDQFDHRISIHTAAHLGTRNLTLQDRSELVAIYESRTSQDYLYRREKVYRTLISSSVPRVTHGRWGWKEPNSHVVLSHLLRVYPDLRYIHVVRNGLDMMFNSNQNQVKFWKKFTKLTYRVRLNYWIEVHNKIIALKQQYPDNIFVLKYEDLCINPDQIMNQLTNFLNLPRNTKKIDIRPSADVNIYQAHPEVSITESDRSVLNLLGYVV
jgi:hypothetical protein